MVPQSRYFERVVQEQGQDSAQVPLPRKPVITVIPHSLPVSLFTANQGKGIQRQDIDTHDFKHPLSSSFGDIAMTQKGEGVGRRSRL